MELFILLGEPDETDLRKHGLDPRTVDPTGSGARARLGRDGSREATEKWQEGGEGRSRLEERQRQRQLSPGQ